MMSSTVEVFWSFRSPYCYLTLDRFQTWKQSYDLNINVRPVYPMAVRDPNFFKSVNSKYRIYHSQDYARVGEYLGMPIRRPVPDPITMELKTNAIAEIQPHIRKITRLGAAAQIHEKSFAFVNHMMRKMWDGQTDNWNSDDHFIESLIFAELDANAILAQVENNPESLEKVIEQNQQNFDLADHWGVPCMIFDGETFYGQDRMEILLWRMKQKGLAPRT